LIQRREDVTYYEGAIALSQWGRPKLPGKTSR
jgi:hypothetical protein